MTKFKTTLASAALILCFGAGSAFAQAATPAAPAAAAAPANNSTATATDVAKCAAEADKQGLTGDARGTFTADCEKKAGKQ